MEIRGLKTQADAHCVSVIQEWKAHCAMISAQIVPATPVASPGLSVSLQPGDSSFAPVSGSSSPMAVDPPAAKRKAACTLQEAEDAEKLAQEEHLSATARHFAWGDEGL